MNNNTTDNTLQLLSDNVNSYTLKKLFDNNFVQSEEDSSKTFENAHASKVLQTVLISLIIALTLYYLNFPNWFCLIVFVTLPIIYFTFFVKRVETNDFGTTKPKKLQQFVENINYYRDISSVLFEEFNKKVDTFDYYLNVYKAGEFIPGNLKNIVNYDYLPRFDNYNEFSCKYDPITYKYNVLDLITEASTEILNTFNSYAFVIDNKGLLIRHNELYFQLETILEEIINDLFSKLEWDVTQCHRNIRARHLENIDPFA